MFRLYVFLFEITERTICYRARMMMFKYSIKWENRVSFYLAFANIVCLAHKWLVCDWANSNRRYYETARNSANEVTVGGVSCPANVALVVGRRSRFWKPLRCAYQLSKSYYFCVQYAQLSLQKWNFCNYGIGREKEKNEFLGKRGGNYSGRNRETKAHTG